MYLMNEKIERCYYINEVCEYLGITRGACLAGIEKRGMLADKIGRTWMLKTSEIDEM